MEADASDEHPSDELPGERSSEQHYGAGPEAASHIADYSFLFDPSVQPISVQLTVHGAAKHLDFGLAMVVTGYMAGEKTLVCAYHTMGSTLDLSMAKCLLMLSQCLLMLSQCLLMLSQCLLILSQCLLMLFQCLLPLSQCLLMLSQCWLMLSQCLVLLSQCWLLLDSSGCCHCRSAC